MARTEAQLKADALRTPAQVKADEKLGEIMDVLMCSMQDAQKLLGWYRHDLVPEPPRWRPKGLHLGK